MYFIFFSLLQQEGPALHPVHGWSQVLHRTDPRREAALPLLLQPPEEGYHLLHTYAFVLSDM